MTTRVLTLSGEQVMRHDDVRDKKCIFVEIMSTFKAKTSSFEMSYDKQNITLVVILYEISYEMTTRVISSI